MVSGVIDFEKGRVGVPAPMSAAEVRTLCAAARARGRAAFAHASGAEGIENALAGDVESVEHGFFVTHEQLARMRDRRIAWVPTFAPVRAQLELADVLGWRPPTIDHVRRILDEHAESLRHAAETGVVVLAGSDAGSIGVAHGRGLLRELELMERAGMRSLDVLNSATGVSASHLGLDHQLGCLRTGRRPRMILTERDPLESVTHLGQDAIRLFDGQVLEAPHPDPSGL
jgi:imidazolonepropionase-like amidohydrolase